MKNRNKPFLCIAALLPIAALTMSGCGGGGSNGANPSQSMVSAARITTTRQYNALQITTTAPAEVLKGQGYPVDITIANTGTADVVMAFTTFIQNDALIQKEGYSFSLSESLLSPKRVTAGIVPMEIKVTLKPGESKTLLSGISGVSGWNDDKWADIVEPVSPGTYTAQFWLQTYNINGTTLSRDEQKANLSSSPMQVTVK